MKIDTRLKELIPLKCIMCNYIHDKPVPYISKTLIGFTIHECVCGRKNLTIGILRSKDMEIRFRKLIGSR